MTFDRPDEFDVQVRSVDLPASVRAARDADKQANQGNEAIILPMIAAHLEAYRAAVDPLSALHANAAETTDLDLAGESRQAAAWAVSGRALGLLDAAVGLVEAGYATEVVPLLRSTHETLRLLEAVATHDDTAILRDWIAGHHIKHSRVLAAHDRWQKSTIEDMRREGVTPPERTRSYFDELYASLSAWAHPTRKTITEQLISVEARRMPVGTHPDVRVRASCVGFTGQLVREALMEVGWGLVPIFGPQAAVDYAQPIFYALSDLMERIPLDAAALAGRDRPV